MIIIEKEFNVLTGETIISEREATPNEIAAFEKAQLEKEEEEKVRIKTESLRKALLEKLGITEEEAKILLS